MSVLLKRSDIWATKKPLKPFGRKRIRSVLNVRVEEARIALGAVVVDRGHPLTGTMALMSSAPKCPRADRRRKIQPIDVAATMAHKVRMIRALDSIFDVKDNRTSAPLLRAHR
jgi:hypothetical protein